MATEPVVEVVLEQRDRKPRKAAAESNGHAEVPDFGAVEEFAADAPIAGDSTDAPEEAEESSSATNKIYFVRVPRPPINDDLVKKLSAQFQDQVAKLKGMNAKLATKREELRELRRQLGVGRSLKDGSQPEFEEKLTRLKQLRDLRNGYVQKMQAIKENLRGLDCKSEEELDAKVKELEGRISHGSLVLREEKMVVGQISKLQAQRTQIRDYDNQKNALTELENESSKIKVVIAELENEFTILKTERDQAQGIIKEIFTKVKACEAEVKDLEDEQKEAVAAKNESLAALEKARTDMNDSMVDYRENRSFSLKVRDLVTAGQVDEARALCVTQTEELVARLGSDAAFRKEYYHLWALQRKYAVSELLPDSSTAAREAKQEAGGGKAGAKGGKDAKGAKAPPPKPQGAEKARALIEQLMAEAQVEASRKVAARPAADDAASSGDADDELDAVGPSAPEPAPEPAPAKSRAAAPSARPADVLKHVELPKIDDEEFVPPVIKTDADKAASEQDKERLREEQAKKAAEAELRKKKLAEAKEKKRKEGEAKRKEGEEARKAAEAAAAAERAKQAAVERAEAEARRKAAAEAAKAAAEAKQASSNPAAKVIAKSQVTVAAKAKPQAGSDLLRYWKLLRKDSTLQLALVAAVLIVVMAWLVIQATRA